MLEIQQYNYLPPGFLSSSAKNLHKVLPKPSLIHLKGKKENPLFISILQHGNETVGLLAVQMLLRSYKSEMLPRSLSIFVANVDAASQGLRRLEGQPDYNRMWPGGNIEPLLPEVELMQQVYDEMCSRQPFASVDLHSNTGLNPHYACINKKEHQFYHLATLFAKMVVYFVQPKGVQSIAFSTLCPSVTLECGQINDESGVEHAFEFLDACMQLIDIPAHKLQPDDMSLFHTVAIVKIPKTVSFSFNDSTQDIYFSTELETLNFRESEKGKLFGVTHVDKKVSLDVKNEFGEDVFRQYFSYEANEIRLKKPLMLSMITLDEKIIRQDCFCYLMEKIAY